MSLQPLNRGRRSSQQPAPSKVRRSGLEQRKSGKLFCGRSITPLISSLAFKGYFSLSFPIRAFPIGDQFTRSLFSALSAFNCRIRQRPMMPKPSTWRLLGAACRSIARQSNAIQQTAFQLWRSPMLTRGMENCSNTSQRSSLGFQNREMSIHSFSSIGGAETAALVFAL